LRKVQGPNQGSGDDSTGGTSGGGSGGQGQGGSAGGGGGTTSTTGTSTGTGTSSTPSSGVGTFTDQKGRFKIGYPQNAIVKPVAEGTLGDKVVTFNGPPPTEFTTIGIEVSETESPIDLESQVNSHLVELDATVPSYSLVEPPDCVRYTLGVRRHVHISIL
jgi:hypothetical protein